LIRFAARIASIPTKCIDQMPQPIVTAAPDSRALRAKPLFGTNLRARRNPV